MSDEYLPDILTLCGEDEKISEFEVLDIIEYQGEKYYVLLPRYGDSLTALKSSADYLVLKAEQKDEEIFFSAPEHDITSVISGIFEEKYNAEFYGG